MRYRVIGQLPVVVDGIARAPGDEFETTADLSFLLTVGAVAVVPPAADADEPEA